MAQELLFKRVLLKISGEALAGEKHFGLDFGVIGQVTDVIKECVELGVQVGIVIREKDNDKFKISMRSASDIDVSAICQKFGGGGHVKAAGCTLEGPLDDVKLRLLSAVAPAMGIDLWLA